MVSIQCCELLAVMPGERVTSIAMVTAHSELVEVGLRLHSEAGILCKHLPTRPVLQCDQQFVISLISQPVDVLQTQPVLTVNIAKTLLWSAVIRKKNIISTIRKSSLNVLWKALNSKFGLSGGWFRVGAPSLEVIMSLSFSVGLFIVKEHYYKWTLWVKFIACIRCPDFHYYSVIENTAGYSACNILVAVSLFCSASTVNWFVVPWIVQNSFWWVYNSFHVV